MNIKNQLDTIQGESGLNYTAILLGNFVMFIVSVLLAYKSNDWIWKGMWILVATTLWVAWVMNIKEFLEWNRSRRKEDGNR